MGDFQKIHDVLGHLPVGEVADMVVQDVKAGKVGILAAPTGSGKSLLVSAMLADSSAERVVVLMPRRLLVTDAAKNIAEMLGTELGDKVGYALGAKPGEESKFSPNTKLLFCTYGYALSSGLIKRANSVVLDEVHEQGEDISLARAILHQRKRKEPNLHLLEMSATVNAQKQASYWQDVATPSVYKVEKSNLTYDERFVSTTSEEGIDAIAQNLLEEGRKGIAIFMQGSKEIYGVIAALERRLTDAGIHDVEIAPIYGDLDAAARKAAVKPPKEGGRKIIVGTNVIESGVNLRWVDAGISNGIGKIPYTRPETGAEALVEENLPRWRIEQQRGRINRDPKNSGFDEGIFVLRAQKDMQGRVQDATPEIERVSPVGLVFQAVRLNIDPTTLKFDARLTKPQLLEARTELQRLGLLEPTGWRLSEDGRFAARLPVSPEAGAMLCEAKRLDEAHASKGEKSRVLFDAITLVAVMESKGLRADYKTSHGMHTKSDLLDGFMAYQALGLHAGAGQAPVPNVSRKRYLDASQLIIELRERLSEPLQKTGNPHTSQETRYKELERVILSGGVNRLFIQEFGNFRDVLRGNEGFESSRGSVAQEGHSALAVGKLREISTKEGDKTILDMVTRIPEEVFLAWAADRKDTVLTDLHLEELRGKKTGGTKHQQHAPRASVLRGTYFGQGNLELFVPASVGKEMQGSLHRLQMRDHAPPTRGAAYAPLVEGSSHFADKTQYRRERREERNRERGR